MIVDAKNFEQLTLWGIEIPCQVLNEKEKTYLASLPSVLPPVEWVWAEMDRVWDSYGLNNRETLAKQAIAEFYSDPVWLMNGVFTSLDPASESHRNFIAQFTSDNDFKLIADYAGGFGELALKMAQKSPNSIIKLIEPYPSRYGLFRLNNKENIEINSSLGISGYDIVIAQDVLEHVEDPVGLAITLTEAVHDGGWVVFANCFYPVMKCHLPSTFHLRHTFRFVMSVYGLEYRGCLPGAEHVMIFRKIKKLSKGKARVVEFVSKSMGGFINMTLAFLSRVKKSIKW